MARATSGAGRIIRRVTIVHRDGDRDGLVATAIRGDERPRKKKQSKGLRVVERLARRLAKAAHAGTSEYLTRHREANRRKRDGWARELSKNLARAQRKSLVTLLD